MQNTTISDFQNLSHAKPSIRVSKACHQCRARHVRCGAEIPICSRCHAKGEQCLYQKSRRGGRRPRKPPQSCDLGMAFTSTDYQLPRTQPQNENPCSSLEETSSRTASSDSSSNNPAQSAATPTYRLNPTDITTDSSPIHSNKTMSASTEQQSSLPATDELLESYYTMFHPAHPCALPRLFFKQRLEADPQSLWPVLSVMQYIGSLYSPSALSAPLEVQVQQTLAERSIASPKSGGYHVQALILYSIAVYWCNEIDRGLKLLDEAISMAVNLGMNLQSFAAEYGCGDPVLEESWRRTWWVIYITDAHLAGSTHTYPFKTTNVPMNVDLPCEEDSYALGNIPRPRLLSEYDMREFTEDDGREFSSFAQLIGLARTLDTVFFRGRQSDSDAVSVLAADLDASIMGWHSLLAQSNQELLRVDGTVDEHLFRANMLLHTYIVDTHRPLSNLAYSAVESASRCAPPSPPAHTANSDVALLALHTSKILCGIEAVNKLLTFSGSLKAHSPFLICMIANTTIAYLSACRYVLPDQALKLAREKIRLNMGVLKALGGCWPLAKRTYREVGVIAREILCLEDQDIAVPVRDSLPDLPQSASTPLNFNLDSWFDMVDNEQLDPMNLCSNII